MSDATPGGGPAVPPELAETVTAMEDMGFSRAQSVLAAQIAGAAGGLEGAINCIAMLQEQEAGFTPPGSDWAAHLAAAAQQNMLLGANMDLALGLKATVVVRKDLGMSPGKIAAQVAHAAIALVTSKCPPNSEQAARVQQWQANNGEKLVVLEIPSLAELEALMATAAEL
eukprot:gene14-122_t